MFSETVELRGHIIDSLILPKVLDTILTSGGNFKIGEIKIGEKRARLSRRLSAVAGIGAAGPLGLRWRRCFPRRLSCAATLSIR